MKRRTFTFVIVNVELVNDRKENNLANILNDVKFGHELKGFKNEENEMNCLSEWRVSPVNDVELTNE